MEAAKDWQELNIPGFSDEITDVLTFTTDSGGDVFIVYWINDPSGQISAFPRAMKYDGITWTELDSGPIAEMNGRICLFTEGCL